MCIHIYICIIIHCVYIYAMYCMATKQNKKTHSILDVQYTLKKSLVAQCILQLRLKHKPSRHSLQCGGPQLCLLLYKSYE